MPPHSSSGHHPLRISPRELVFKLPLDRVSTALLKLHNIGQSPVVYKVKTTAPQRYCVRPNNGILSPGETIEVQVLLNFVKDAPVTLETKDKFQIQSIVLSGPLNNPSDVGEVWAKASPEQITKQKLRSKFVSQEEPKAPALVSSTSQEHQQHDPHPPASTTSTSTTSTSSTSSFLPQDTPQTSTLHTSQFQSSLSSSQSSSMPSLPTVPPSQPLDTKSTSSLGDSSEQHQYSTPQIGSISQSESKATRDMSHLPILEKSEISTKESHLETIFNTPKQTGDYVVDTVANFSQLRKSLEQVASLKSERDGYIKENQRLNEHIKNLVEQLQRSKDEAVSVPTLRQRTTHQTPAPLPSNVTTTRPDQQMFIQIQTKVLLFVVLFFTVFGFVLGRFTH